MDTIFALPILGFNLIFQKKLGKTVLPKVVNNYLNFKTAQLVVSHVRCPYLF